MSTNDCQELRECPFCGGEADTSKIEGRWIVYHYCEEPETHAALKKIETAWYETEAEAIEAWNTRAERTCHDIAPMGAEWFMCSECEKGTHKVYEYNYCPNCGARVIKSDQDLAQEVGE